MYRISHITLAGSLAGVSDGLLGLLDDRAVAQLAGQGTGEPLILSVSMGVRGK
jgi:hypothetical protein